MAIDITPNLKQKTINVKIAFVTWNFNKVGGIERCVFELVSILKEKHQVHVFSTDEKLQIIPGVIFHKIPIIRNIFVLKILSFFITSFFVVKKANRLAKFDIIHLHNPSLLKPDIYTLHSVHAEGVKFQESSLKWYFKLFFRIKTAHPVIMFLSKFNYSRSRHLVAISKQIKNEVLKIDKYVSPEKVSIIYHGVNTSDFMILDSEKKKGIRDQLAIDAGQKVILFVANEFKRKGLDILLNAISKLQYLDKINLIIVGESNDGYLNTDEAKQLAIDFKIADNCLFVGRSDDVGLYFSIADLFVLPTIYEPLGMVYMEAMAAGVPTLVSKVAGMADLIEDGKDGILVSNNPSDIAGLIDKLYEDPACFSAIGLAGKHKIEKYTWAFSAKEYEDLYYQLKARRETEEIGTQLKRGNT